MLSKIINPLGLMATVEGEDCRVLCKGGNRLIILRDSGNVREVVVENGVITECTNLIVAREVPRKRK